MERKVNKETKKRSQAKVFSKALEIANADKERSKRKVYLVVGIKKGLADDGDDLISDIIGIYTSKTQARRIRDRVKNRKPIKNLSYEYLADFDDCEMFIRNLGETITTPDHV